ncbi:MAG: NAD(P)H-hydrate dehydratase, partial [Clostridia bacterium]|nr:NAD(P)H-hydrate dehydratase [Clostridia bacterium]
PSLTLMERAGEALKNEAMRLAPKGKILVVCGGGNNGGDGFVCARKLLKSLQRVDVVYVGKVGSEECQISRAEFEMNGGKIMTSFPTGERYSLVIDCVFGTGFAPRGGEDEIFARINDYKSEGSLVLSADIPSGLCEDGKVRGSAVEADETLCFGYIKTATVLQDGLDYCGEVVGVDIGIALTEPAENYADLVTEDEVKTLFPKRKRNTHKGSYGKAAIVGGSMRYSGAAALAIESCVRGGAGYSSLYLPQSLLPAFLLKTPEALLIPCNERYDEKDYIALLTQDAVGFGIGATTEKRTQEILRFLLKNYEGKLTIDADGLNALAEMDERERTTLLINKKCTLLLTPHAKEFSRLLGTDVEELQKNALSYAKDYAKRYRLTVLLKGATTIVTDGTASKLCICGNAGLAKGGSGDTLTGLITSLAATGLSLTDSGVAATFLAGTAAELACRNMGENALTARDVITYLGRAFLEFQR